MPRKKEATPCTKNRSYLESVQRQSPKFSVDIYKLSCTDW